MKKTIGKRALGWLLCVCMIVAMIPVLAIPALAAVFDDDGDEFINGILLSEDVKYYDEDGNVVLDWDSSSKTLTLTNFEFAPESTSPPAIQIPGGSELVLNGTSIIDGYASPVVEALGDLAVSGSGSLVLNLDALVLADSFTVSNAIDAPSDCALYVGGTLTVNSGTLDCIVNRSSGHNSYGVFVESEIIANGGSLYGESGGASNDSYGVFAGSNITLSDSASLTGIGSSATYGDSVGVYTRSGKITVTGATLTGTASYTEKGCYGVHAAGSISVSDDGTLKGTAGEGFEISAGVYAGSTITVSGTKSSVTGTVGAVVDNSYGVYAKGNIIVSGGSLYGDAGSAYVDSYGIYTGGDMTVTGGNVYGTGGDIITLVPSSMTILVANSYGDPYSYGIYVNEYFRMTAGYLVGYGQTYGLYIDEDYSIASDLIIKGGTTERTASEIYASQIANYEYIEISEAEEEDATYTVKFDSNGGSSVASQKVVEGKKAGEPIDPTKYGYSFVGWYTDIQLTNKYDFNTKVTSDFTLYAKWQFSGEGDTPPPFTDIDGHWAKTYIEYLSDKGYVQGIGGGLFAPNANMTRAQFVQIVYNAYGNGAVAQAVSFEDVDQSAWYAAAVNWAFEKGIVTGYDDTSFGPNDPVTREQMATMIVRLCNSFGISLTPAKEKYTFADDESIADYAKDAVYALQMCGVVEGKGNNMFAPKDTTTRGEMAKILYLVVR